MLANINLRQTLHRFRPDEFGTLGDLREASRAGTHRIMMISCADHGLAAEDLSFAKPGRCLLVKNMAASIPAAGAIGDASTLANIAHGITRKRVQDLIVCNHLGCNVIPRWLQSPVEQNRNDPCGSFSQNARIIVDSFYRCRTDWERLALMICEHTLFQLENLRSHKFIHTRLRNRQLRLHGWIVADTTARVFCFDPAVSQFVSLERTHC